VPPSPWPVLPQPQHVLEKSGKRRGRIGTPEQGIVQRITGSIDVEVHVAVPARSHGVPGELVSRSGWDQQQVARRQGQLDAVGPAARHAAPPAMIQTSSTSSSARRGAGWTAAA
jgi:hypothetical protein